MSKFVGHDVRVFAVEAAGQDGNPANGATTNFLGRWESIEVTLTNQWATVSSSDATQPEKRWKMAEFTASLKTWIDNTGSQQMLLFGQAQLVVVTFTEINSGRVMVLRAGISKASATWNMDSGKDSVELEDVGSGNFNGAATFSYA